MLIIKVDWLVDLFNVRVNTDDWIQVHSAWSSLVVTHPSTNRG